MWNNMCLFIPHCQNKSSGNSSTAPPKQVYMGENDAQSSTRLHLKATPNWDSHSWQACKAVLQNNFKILKYSWHVQRPLEFQLGDCISKEQLITSRLPLNQTRPFLLQLLGWIKGAFAHTFLAPQGPRVHRWETQSDPWVLQSAALEEITLDDVKFQPNLTFPVSNWKEQQKPQKPNKNNADGTLTAKYEELGIPK